MKTLDEVIKALECCLGIGKCRTECPYKDDCLDDREKKDALYYLKMYHELAKDSELFAEWKENPPLSWDELRKMEGNPVWIEYDDHFPGRKGTKFKEWEVINCIFDDRIVAKGDWDYHKSEQGDVWQAYRKERSE